MRNTSVNLETLKSIQEELRKHLITVNALHDYEFVGGCDVSYESDHGKGVIVVIDRKFNVVEISAVSKKIDFPYIPGFLAFREVPFLLEAYEKLKLKPDILLVDGQGIAHPRGFGVACHLGVLLNKPTIGAAKSKLYGRCEIPPLKRGFYTYLLGEDDKVIGACLVTKDRCKPIYVSQGHMVDLETAVKVVLENTVHYRIPEPLRIAHKYSKAE
ncbi:MAG: endonuclease V [candidate division WOR-3 bacterium]